MHLHHSLQLQQQPQPPPLFSQLPEATSAAGLFSTEDRNRFGRSENRSESECRVREGNWAADVDSSYGVNFSDPGGYFSADVKESTESAFPSAADANTSSKERRNSSENNLGDFSCDSEGPEGSDVPTKQVPHRTSSKRSRAAEVHNLSEKRRRSRINEKMKALQNLIPNSNKTDKASMLDEAIDYLKQLQLQVQMLSMGNGLSLHPMCIPGILQPLQLSHTGMGFDEGNGYLNSSRGIGTFSGNEESSRQSAFNLPSLSNEPIFIPSATNIITTSESSFGFEESVQAHYEPLNLSSSK